jgi:phosphoribosyl 1,2-cyclic phosphodiesterase
VAFVIALGEASFGHATDVGHLSRGLVDALRSCDAILVESNYDPALLRDGPYPWSLKERILGPFGHLSNAEVGRLIENSLGEACRQIVLAHLSRKNNHPELALLAADEALTRAGRRGLRVSVAGPGGTDWVSVRPAGADRKRGNAPRSDRQLRLF